MALLKMDADTNSQKILVFPRHPEFAGGDQPHLHRWRAHWDKGWDGGVGILLIAYPVVKVTRQGAWIDPFAYWDNTQWSPESGSRRWVSDVGSSSWAKANQETALHSIAVRLSRWAMHIRSDRDFMIECAKSLAILRPQTKILAEAAIKTVDER